MRRRFCVPAPHVAEQAPQYSQSTTQSIGTAADYTPAYPLTTGTLSRVPGTNFRRTHSLWLRPQVEPHIEQDHRTRRTDPCKVCSKSGFLLAETEVL